MVITDKITELLPFPFTVSALQINLSINKPLPYDEQSTPNIHFSMEVSCRSYSFPLLM